jgi:hypothetical protein
MPNYKISFSDSTKKITAPIFMAGSDGSLIMVQGEKTEREMELVMLCGLAEIAANSHKGKKEINIALDLAGRIENLSNSESSIIIDNADKANLEKGIEDTANKRPSYWLKCRSMWKQLDSMEEIKVTEAK